jgi:hypothetical protein
LKGLGGGDHGEKAEESEEAEGKTCGAGAQEKGGGKVQASEGQKKGVAERARNNSDA